MTDQDWEDLIKMLEDMEQMIKQLKEQLEEKDNLQQSLNQNPLYGDPYY